jgi:hypothetical protein
MLIPVSMSSRCSGRERLEKLRQSGRNAEFEMAFERGGELIIENQLEDGGWGYGEGGDCCYRKTGRGDLSVTGWQYQALKAAKNSGVKIHNLHKASTRVVNYLLSTKAKDGGFEGANRDAGYNQWNLTGCGLLGA